MCLTLQQFKAEDGVCQDIENGCATSVNGPSPKVSPRGPMLDHHWMDPQIESDQSNRR